MCYCSCSIYLLCILTPWLQMLFQTAIAKAPTMIFFDEADWCFADKSRAIGDNQSKYTIHFCLINFSLTNYNIYSERSILLSKMGDLMVSKSPVLICAATNHPSKFENSFLRRFHKLACIHLFVLIYGFFFFFVYFIFY